MGRECIQFWRAAGGELFDWQEFVIEAMLGLGEDDRWVSVEDGLDVARQNGKGVVLQAIEVFFAFELGARCGYRVVMHTAHEFATSQDHQRRLDDVVQDCPHLHARVKDRGGYMHANGQESINLRDGTRIIFKARTKGGARGWSGDLLVWDEAMVIPETVVGAQRPTLRASKAAHGHKIIFAGSAVDQEVHEYGVTFARLRERGIDQAPRVSWHEWSMPFDDPREAPEEALTDRRFWHMANPSMEHGLISEQTMADEVASMAARTALVELGGVGDWPRTDGREEMMISIEAWDALEDPASLLQLDHWVLGVDVSPERRTSIAAAGWNQDGVPHVEIQESRAGTGWVVERIVEMVERGNPNFVVLDAVGPAGSLIVPLTEAGVQVEVMNTPEHGQACGRLLDMVTEKRLVHLGSAELRDAVRGARPRPLGDAWAWSRKSSSVDISPLVAATLALGAAAGVGVGELVIF